jgi:hypothetical protein
MCVYQCHHKPFQLHFELQLSTSEIYSLYMPEVLMLSGAEGASPRQKRGHSNRRQAFRVRPSCLPLQGNNITFVVNIG